MALNLNCLLSIYGAYTKASDATAPAEQINIRQLYEFTNGTGANQLQVFYSNILTATTTETLTFGTSLDDIYGADFSPTEQRLFAFINYSSDYEVVLSGTAISEILNEAGSNLLLKKNGMLVTVAPREGHARSGAETIIATTNTGVALNLLVLLAGI